MHLRSRALSMLAPVAGLMIAASGCTGPADQSPVSSPATAVTSAPGPATPTPGPVTSTPEPATPTAEPATPGEGPSRGEGHTRTSPEDAHGEGSPDPQESSSARTPLPTDAVAYADAFIIAWGAGDQERMSRLGSPQALETVTDYAPAGGPEWQREEADAGAGSVYVAYKNAADGARVTLRLANEEAATGQDHAIIGASFGPDS